MSKTLQKSLQLGPCQLKHRVVLAPLTRLRGGVNDLAPMPSVEEYYEQRATEGGLLITEAVLISPEGMYLSNQTGIWTDQQTDAWKSVVDRVHKKKGLISIQLWHTGRCAHESFRRHPLFDPIRAPTVSASDIAAPGKTSDADGNIVPYSTPRPLRHDEFPRVLEDYRRAARNAKRAGFDFIEIHGAHGYLLDQFLNDGVNKRTDEYGGSLENRSRLIMQVVDACQEAFDPSRVAIRISPHAEGTMKFYGADDSNPDSLYAHVISELDKKNLAYLLLSEPRPFFYGGKDVENAPEYEMGLINPPKFRSLYRGTIIGAGGFSPLAAEKAVASGAYDAIAFGRWFISNPDLPSRIFNGEPLCRYDRATFYTHDSKGYTDYTTYANTSEIHRSELVQQEKIGKTLASL